MSSIKKNIKIATILPYKENYTSAKASAASLWVSEFYKKSKFNKTNHIYGHTKNKDYLTKNYFNIELSNIKSKFRSATNEYINKLVKKFKYQKYDLIEIHNRPVILNELTKKIKSRYIMYFHNDPLSMNGSKSINQRLNIISKVEKVIFVSEWTQKRFFIDIDDKLKTKTEVVYPSVNYKKKISKKDKFITFIGKLNRSKGYDLFAKVIVRILDEFPMWNAYSLGDEERRDIYIKHKNHHELGFLKHKDVLELLDKTSISVVPSRWEEPFGRTALEASSRGCATVISNKGGLPETTNQAIILKNLNEETLYKQIRNLIKNTKKRIKIQKNSQKNVQHIITSNAKIIDRLRIESLPYSNFNFIKKKIKILNIYNQGQKLNHRLYNISIGKKLSNGFIRNGHDVLEISDRDYIRKNRSLNFLSKKNTFQKYLLETFKNYNPDLLLFGHTKNIDHETIDNFKNINRNLIVSQWNEDPVMPSLKYSRDNILNIKRYSNLVDHTFITTHPDELIKQDKNFKNIHFFFVPVDRNIEFFDVYKLNPQKDLFYAMSHGVNRAVLKDGIEDDRILFLDKLVKKIPNIKYDFYGFANKQPIWGNNFFRTLINSKMALNLSRGKPTRYYSSNRIASIMGNGLLTFIDNKVKMNHFFSNKEIIFYDNIHDLSEKIKFYANNDKLRIEIAKNGKKKYFQLFNEKKISKYIIDISLGKKYDLF
tara:strand:+ start:135 stop:2261 length:2127 start_codon:yes stop_codon:yes gene_type:complete